jgi:MATE family multidrug resistance protein
MPRDRLHRILVLSLPIMAGMVSQNIFNLVDTAMVGTLGNSALAAVGIAGFASFTMQAVLMGVSMGVQAMASRWKGEGRLIETGLVLNAALLLIIVIAPPFSAVLYWLAPIIFPYLISDPAVVDSGVPYLQLRILATVFMGMNFAFRGYWNAVDMSKIYMKTLIGMHVSNILLNYIFIFGNFGAPALGVTGAGLATALSTVVGTSIYLWLGFRHARGQGFLRGLPPAKDFASLVRLSVPGSIQQLFFSAGFTLMYWIIGQVGTAELAAANVLLNVFLVALLPGVGLGIAASTLVGQALGRGEPEDAHRWAWDVVMVAIFVMGGLGLPMVAMPDMILGVFLHDAATIDLARWPMRVVGGTMIVEAFGVVLMSALQGAGATRSTMIVSVLIQWLFFLPLAFVVGPVLGWGLLAIWIAQACYRTLQAGVFWMQWQRRDWASIQL